MRYQFYNNTILFHSTIDDSVSFVRRDGFITISVPPLPQRHEVHIKFYMEYDIASLVKVVQ